MPVARLFVVFLIGMSVLRIADGEEIDFNQDIRPILAEYCFQCHGPDSATREAGLRLDLVESATSELESGETAFLAGDSENSEAIRRILHDDEDMRMPPAELGRPLSPEHAELIRRWVDEGASYADHWAFVAVQSPEVPSEARTGNPIDAFVRARLSDRGWTVSPRASRRTLIRRLSLDIRGLPPSLEEIHDFDSDSEPGATDRLIERLLSSPHYGERMAAFWLDGARFADTNGYQNDFNRSMWPYRDWVIRAFNDNMPFDQFTVEQIAGDLLADASTDQKIASGFNRNHRTVTEAGSLEQEWLVENVIDRVETTGTVFLGLTIGCARCHDHKFDPISQREFYQFFDFFHQIDEKGVYTETRGNVEPKIPIADSEQDAQLKNWLDEIRELEQNEQPLKEQANEAFRKWLANECPEAGIADLEPPILQFPLNGDRHALVSGEEVPSQLIGRVEPTVEFGPLGKALNFDGTQWLDCTDVPFSPASDKPFSIAAWVRPQAMGAIVAKMEKPDRFRGFDVLPFAGFVAVHLIHDWPKDAIKVVTKEKLPGDRFSHLAVTYDGSQKAAGVRIYVDGVEAEVNAEKDSLTGSIDNDLPLQIGRRNGGDFYQGATQDLRFYNRVVTPEEICGIITRKLAPVVMSDAEGLKPLREILRRAYIHHGPHAACREFIAAKSRSRAVEKSRQELLTKLSTTMVMKEREQPRDTFVLMRGSYHRPDREQRVKANVPKCLPPMADDAPRNRLGLARWVVSEENPLTARVFVNRVWEQIFGMGLVKSSENFGYRADLPSHPELLDYLASDFMRSGWDVKALIRRIVRSDTYQQTSAVASESYRRDLQNRWLAHGPRFRLPAEFVRDNALAISGLLSPKIGGPSVKPYQPGGLWDELAGGANGGPYIVAEGADLYRRSLYTFRKRTVPHPTLATFDAPSWEICQVKRAVTNTPLQALALMNDVTYLEASRKLGEWMLMRPDAGDDRTRIANGFEKCTGRPPNAAELESLLQGLKSFDAALESKEAAEALISHGKSPRDQRLDAQRLAAFTMLANTLLNLDETITKE